jgi:hypothetical protein
MSKTRSSAPFVAAALLSCSLSAQDILGVTWGGSVYTLDSTTGASTLVGSSGYSRINCLAKDASGTFYACSNPSGGNSILITIDPATGVGTSVATSNIGDVRGLAFGPSGVLYATDANGTDTLWVMDPATAQATAVGSTGMSTIQGLGFAGGVLYAADVSGPMIATLDLASGQGTVVGSSSAALQALFEDSAGNLWGAWNELYRVDPTTGATTQVGSGYALDIRGAAFVGPTLSLIGTPDQISVSAGGSQVLSMDVGAAFALSPYQILGSVSGSAPGFPYAGTVVPLNFDAYLVFTLLNPNTPLLQGSGGVLNSNGQATAVLTLPPASDPSLAGLTVNHAGIVLNLAGGFVVLDTVTNPAPVLLVP